MTSGCRCGFRDPQDRLYRDATIVYFNESNAEAMFTQHFEVKSFLNPYEDGFSTTYRQSAEAEAVALVDGQSLDLTCNVPTDQRIVVGAHIRTRRKDIQYGSFRAGMIPALTEGGGTALTMEYNYNISQKITLDILNQNSPYDTRLDYSIGLPGSAISPFSSNISQNTMAFQSNDYQFDWTEDLILWSASLNKSSTFQVLKSSQRSLPSVPGDITFRHWSDGDPQHAQGPPKSGPLTGKLTYVRLFYNGTTSATKFEVDCQNSGELVCNTEDTSLRMSTNFAPEALISWKYHAREYVAQRVPLFLSTVSLAVFVLIFAHALIGRLLRSYTAHRQGKSPDPPAYVHVMDKSNGFVEKWSRSETGAEIHSAFAKTSEQKIALETYDRTSHAYGSIAGPENFFSSASIPTLYEINGVSKAKSISGTTSVLSDGQSSLHSTTPKTAFLGTSSSVIPHVHVQAISDVKINPILQSVRPRMDYLDGFRGLVCILVSLIHFFLTFYIGAINPSTPIHYSFESWFRKVLSPVVLNASIVLGIFFILSARLIGVRYLRNRNLEELAGSTYRRVPRLYLPVVMAVTLEYFLISVGGTEWLRYLASVTWSTWPYTTVFPNAGYFFNELLALLFIIPNALPRIIYNYCTGVLWTIPVNIQYSWLCFLGVVVIKESKSAVKRFLYYGICILTNWYALNWGAYFWVGLAIGDLDSTYKYRSWFTTFWRKTALMMVIWSVILCFMALQYLQQVDIVNFPTLEYGIHSDIYTGLPIAQTDLSGFPPFNYPQVYAFFIGTALLVLFDNSSITQRVFSNKWLCILGTHSYSVYLLHGAVFWSWGSFIMIKMHVADVPYWASTLTVFLTSYLLLFVACYFWTPVADVYAMIVSTSLWRYAQGKSLYRTIN